MPDSRTWRVGWNRYAPVLLWIGIIFLMSSDLASSTHTSLIVRPVLEFLFPKSSAETLDLYQWYIRKAAHFTEYGILALLAGRLFRRFLPRSWPVAALVLVASVASLDEWHQSFVASRTSSPYDVLLDTVGGLSVILTVWLLIVLRRPIAD